ncbi:hypothetical protein TDSAC_0025 [Thermodesulfobium acidiphilum]|uniref:Uncharacterized protein n=1 Tax=Thermodesulfobium acidiphilum TaxID=1794699 RepID=A0A2R4VY21_THEAF|nr:hypothetical protein [Thermodesulfobium acidiphilum]AWB09415.1 hypothetical protein TDSAC_0025 [Thermodesulfobium acidiphilum]
MLFQIVVLGVSIFFLYTREIKLRNLYSKLPSESEILELESEMREILYELKDSLSIVKKQGISNKLKAEENKRVDFEADIENSSPKPLDQNGVYYSVIELFYKGLSEIEISRKLNLPKGKVDLILNLEKLKKDFKGGI